MAIISLKPKQSPSSAVVNGVKPKMSVDDFLLSPGPPQEIFYYRFGIGGGIMLFGIIFLLIGIFLF